MENQMIVRIKKYLDKQQQKPLRIQQNGFLINNFLWKK